MFARELLNDAVVKADACSLVVGACARLHAARVMARFDESAARKLLEQALRELDGIPSTPYSRLGIGREVYLLTGAVAPDLAKQLRLRNEHHWQDDEPSFIHVLLRHGHSEAAVDLLLSYDDAGSYPFGMVGAVMEAVADDAVKLALLRRAIEVWLGRPSRSASGSALARRSNRVRNHSRAYGFVSLLTWNWKMLPSEDALHVVRFVASRIVQNEDVPIQAQFDPENRMAFTSGREFLLFEILHVMKRVDPELANSLVPQYPELAAAAALFPFGQESVNEAWKATPPIEAGGTNKGYVVSGGSEKGIAMSTALLDAQQSKQFERAFKQAQAFLDDDLLDNVAVKECWPSTQAFRRLLYLIGEAFGEAGLEYLKQIPDMDLRLFAQVEFAAALAGAPQYSGMEVTASRQKREEWELKDD